MRYRNANAGVELNIVAGTYVVILSIDMEKAKTKGLLGFAIEREDHTENEKYYLKGFKYFKETADKRYDGQLFSTHEHPVQSFFWEDFTAKPLHKYTYTITPMFGKPKFLSYGTGCSATVETEVEIGETHSVFFNRGVAGSLAYARRFGNKRPDEMSKKERDAALAWLSRGLKEALLAFIERAVDARYALRGALYEFEYHEVLKAFKEAQARGVDVKIVYDARKQKKKNEAAITKAGLSKSICIPRKKDPTKIAHNKFIVLLKDGEPIEVWTGSTNITEKGIFGQCNEGHIVRDKAIVKRYLTYWDALSKDPAADAIKKATIAIQKDFAAKQLPGATAVIFSPRPKTTMLGTYADIVDSATGLVCGAFPFSFDKRLKDVLTKDTDHLKYILIDEKTKNTTLETNDRDTLIAYGGYFKDSLFDWLKETSAGKLFKSGTDFVHNKFLLIDPLARKPITITGSANFSANSISSNDENTLLINGDMRVADIYLTEFVRLFNHYYVRSVTHQQPTKAKKKGGKDRKNPIHLYTTDEWAGDFFDNEKMKAKRKMLFHNMPLT